MLGTFSYISVKKFCMKKGVPMGYLRFILCFIVIIILSAIEPIAIQAMDSNVLSKIIINLPSSTLEYYENNQLVKEYSIAIGKPSTPTPIGLFQIIDKEIDPCWYPPDRRGVVVPSGPNNPLGYRWMGFEANYGIHGTNAPWSIGLAVSNGCIRMQEEEVEELFPYVRNNTPVQITYDRVKIRIDKTGQGSIGIYPDVYQYENITLEKVKEKLKDEGLDNIVEDDFLSQLIVEEKGKQIPFATLYNIKINNKKLKEYLISWDNKIYAPAVAIADCLDVKIEWDEQQKLIRGKQHAAPGMVKNNILYVEIEHLPTLFGVKQSWDEGNNCLLVHATELLLKGQLVTYDIRSVKGCLYVPIISVGKALGHKLDWNRESKTLWLGSRKIAVTMLGEELYIEASKISDYFNQKVIWDETVQVLDIKGDCCLMDYSMYLGEMADCNE